MSEIYTIPLCNVELVAEKIAMLNKRATKLGLEPIRLEKVGEKEVEVEDEFGLSYKRKYFEFTVQGERPKLNGWQLIAVVEPLESGENLLKVVPGCDVPVKFREINTTCEHCNTNRRRKQVFLVKHDDGTIRRVGRNCLQDFLGGQSPESIVAAAELLIEAASIPSEDYDYDGPHGRKHVDVVHFVAVARIVSRRFGWVSRANAQPGQSSTADIASLICMSGLGAARQLIEEFGLQAEQVDVEYAEQAVEWGKTQKEEGNFYYNLGVACRLGYVRNDTTGLVAALVSVYNRHLEKQRTPTVTGVHVGTVGIRENFVVRIVGVAPTEGGMYGPSYRVNMLDQANNQLVWWASNDPNGSEDFPQNEPIEITATVKKHDEFRGVKKTVLTRVSRAKPKKEKKKKTTV